VSLLLCRSPPSLLPATAARDLSENQITSVEKGAFEGLTALKELYVHARTPHAAPPAASRLTFSLLPCRAPPSLLPATAARDLRRNQITSVEKGAFEGLTFGLEKMCVFVLAASPLARLLQQEGLKPILSSLPSHSLVTFPNTSVWLTLASRT